jgi:hypothetical protein
LFSYDANGNLISDGANNNYAYDIENRLVSASGAHNATLAYDPLGRLSQLSSNGVTTTFLYDGDALVAEYEGATLRRRYAHWAGSDVPLLSFTDSDFNSPNYLHADQQGSIVMLSGAGTPTINRYDEYGIPRSGNVGRFQYTGQATAAISTLPLAAPASATTPTATSPPTAAAPMPTTSRTSSSDGAALTYDPLGRAVPGDARHEAPPPSSATPPPGGPAVDAS